EAPPAPQADASPASFAISLAPSKRRTRAKVLLIASWATVLLCLAGIVGTPEIPPLGRLIFASLLLVPMLGLTYYWAPLVQRAGWLGLAAGHLVVHDGRLLREP